MPPKDLAGITPRGDHLLLRVKADNTSAPVYIGRVIAVGPDVPPETAQPPWVVVVARSAVVARVRATGDDAGQYAALVLCRATAVAARVAPQGDFGDPAAWG